MTKRQRIYLWPIHIVPIVASICSLGCDRQLPEYFYANQGKIVWQDNCSEHPKDSAWFTVYGYTDRKSGTIHLKRMSFLDRVLTFGSDIVQHEQAHSFLYSLDKSERQRFFQDYTGTDEDFAKDVVSSRNKYVRKLVSGGYRKGS